MRYLIVSAGDRATEQLGDALVAHGEQVLRLVDPEPGAVREVVSFAPDIFVIRSPSWASPPPSVQLVLDLAGFGGRPVIALFTRQEFRAGGRPTGVQDVLFAPYGAERLLDAARVLAGVRDGSDARGPVRCGNVAIDPAARTVHVGGRPVELTYSEFEVLYQLCRYKGRVLRRRDILPFIPADRHPPRTLRTIDVHMARLRQKLEGARGIRIETVRYVGYRCDEQAETPVAAGTR